MGAGVARADDSSSDKDAYSPEELAKWKPGQLKELLSSLGLDASGCAEKRDIVGKIMRHPGGPAAAAAAATARGETVATVGPGSPSSGPEGGGHGDVKPVEREAAVSAITGDGEENDGFVGMTLADYMGRPDENGDNINSGDGNGNHNRTGGPGGGRPGGGGGNRGAGRGGAGDGHPRPLSVAESSTSGGRAELSSTATGRGGKVVRLAPAHIAPPSRPAPEWVVDMQVGARRCRLVVFSDATQHGGPACALSFGQNK